MCDLRTMEDKIFEEWVKIFDNKIKFAKDGAGENYSKAKIKILFIAKETNNTKNWDTREYFNNGVLYKSTYYKKDKNGNYKLNKNGKKLIEHTKGKPISKTFSNIYRWANLFINNINEFKHYNKVPIEKNNDLRKEIFSQIAMVNLKKLTGKEITDTNQLNNAIDKDTQFIKKQLSLYNPDIIICCGNGVFNGFKKIVGKDNIIEMKKVNGVLCAKFNNSIIIDFYHPQATNATKQQQFKILQNIKKEYNII